MPSTSKQAIETVVNRQTSDSTVPKKPAEKPVPVTLPLTGAQVRSFFINLLK